MNTIYARLRGNVGSPALVASRASNHTESRQSERCPVVRRAYPRPVLLMVWRTVATSNRLECRWVQERATATDEGVSCNGFFRQAA